MCADVEKSSSDRRKSVFFNIRLEPKMHEEFVRLAEENERTVAGEIRQAMRRYLDEMAEVAA